MAFGDNMAIDWGIVIAIIPIMGGLIGWLISELRGKTGKKLELEQRIAKIETHLAIIDTKGTSVNESVNSIGDSLTEIKSLMRELDTRTRANEVEIARISPR